MINEVRNGKLKRKMIMCFFRNSLFVQSWRLLNSFMYNDKSINKPLVKIFDNIYQANLWKNPESKSGGGSTISATQTLRLFLPDFFNKYNIHSVLDIPCGDFNWMRMVNMDNLEYIGADIVEYLVKSNNDLYKSNNISFKVLDLTKDELPKVDLIFCKDCLQHLSYQSVWQALDNIMRSESTYLLTTSYPLTIRNYDILDGDYRSLNLMKKPFLFPKPLLSIRELSKDIGNELDKTMYLWKIRDLLSVMKEK